MDKIKTKFRILTVSQTPVYPPKWVGRLLLYITVIKTVASTIKAKPADKLVAIEIQVYERPNMSLNFPVSELRNLIYQCGLA